MPPTTNPTTNPAETWRPTHPDGPVAPGAKLQLLGSGFAWTEGPTSDDHGNVYFVDQPNDRIMLWTIDGKISTWMQPSGYSNGMCFDNAGNIISCADEKNELWRITPDKKVTVLVKDYQGKFLNGPNDVWVRPDGGMYITDPYYKRTWWHHRTPEPQLPVQGVYFLSPDGKTLKLVIDDMVAPNGIIGPPDGKTLYVSDIKGGFTYVYTINEDGSLSNKKLFCKTGSDGMTIDSDGNIYTTRTAFRIWDKNGNQLEEIPFRCGNCCFGGKDGHMLFICADHEVYGLQMNTYRVGPQ